VSEVILLSCLAVFIKVRTLGSVGIYFEDICLSFLSDYFCVSFSQTVLNECITGRMFLLHFIPRLHFRSLSTERVTIQFYWFYWILVYA
jgi:hypothetical protein